MLAASAGSAAEPFDADVRIADFGNAWRIARIEDGHGDRARMNTSVAFGRRNTLNSVATCLVVKLVRLRALEFEDKERVSGAPIRSGCGAVPSTLGDGELDIGAGKIGDEKLGVLAAFACSDLDGSLGHGRFPSVCSVFGALKPCCPAGKRVRARHSGGPEVG